MHPFSQRLPWSAPINRLSQALRQKQQDRAELTDLTETNPTNAGFDYPHEAIRAALAKPFDFVYRPDPLGVEAARTAIAGYYRERGFAASPERIALTASTSEAYSLLFKLLCDAGDEILIPTPSYPLFEHLAALESVRTVAYRLGYDGSWYLDFDSLRKQITPRTRALVVVNPNNPTGSFLKADEERQLVELANQHDLALISDEVFMDYELQPGLQRAKSLIDETGALSFSLNGLSKTAGMPQMKLAWMTINGPLPEQQRARERLELLLDTYLSVNTPVQQAVTELLFAGTGMREAILERTRENYAACRRIFDGSPVHVLAVEGGWSVIWHLPRVCSEEEWLLALLAQQNVLLQPGFFFDLPQPACAVASLLVRPDVFAAGAARVRQFVSDVCR